MAWRPRALFPPAEPYALGMLAVSDGHEIYFEQSGNPAGKPVLVVHGGPGGGSSPLMRRYHNPARHRIIQFDQRGCGRSKPHGSIIANTTNDLVDDIERLRRHLDVERWQLFGGSWGATLSLAYALAHPDRVLEMILRGIFLMRRIELDWFYRNGCNWLFPEAYRQLAEGVPEAERDDLVAAYYRRLTSNDDGVRRRAAVAWGRWEAQTLSVAPDPLRISQFEKDEKFAHALALLETHYFVHGGFLPRDGYLLEKARELSGIAGIIVQGRYDVVTPARSAVELHRQWSGSRLVMVDDAGHALSEPGITGALLAAVDDIDTPVRKPQ